MPKIQRILATVNPVTLDTSAARRAAQLAKLLDAFNHRSDVTPIVESKLKCDTLLVCGGKAESHVKGMEALFAVCDKTKTSMIKVIHRSNILFDAATGNYVYVVDGDACPLSEICRYAMHSI